MTLLNGNVSIDPQDGDAANSPYNVTVEASDNDGGTATKSFQVTVEEPVAYRVNASENTV